MALVDAHVHFDESGWRLDEQLERAASAGIDASILSFARPVRDLSQASELNDMAAALVGAAPARIGALATLPLPDIDGALAELDHALSKLALDGVLLHTHYDGAYLGDSMYASLFAELDRRAATVLVHAATPVGTPETPFAAGPLECRFDLARATMSLLYGGTLRDCPSVRFQVANAGGTTIFLHDRIRAVAGIRSEWADRVAPGGPVAHLRRLHFDTASAMSAEQAQTTCCFVGATGVVYGSDGCVEPPTAWLAELQRDNATRCLRQNALRLYPSLGRRVTAA